MNEIDLSAEANRLPTIKFRDYDNSVKEFDPRYVLPFDTNNLPFESQATTYFQIAQLTEQANFAWKNSKVELDGIRSSLYTYYLRNLSKDTKKPTENNISAHIMQDKRYTDAFNKTNLMVELIESSGYSLLSIFCLLALLVGSQENMACHFITWSSSRSYS